MLHYLYTFCQVLALEFPFYWLYLRRRLALRPALILVFLINALTHPIVFFGFMSMHQSYIHSILPAEVFAWGVEGAICAVLVPQLGTRRALEMSFVANFMSWQFGPILTYFIYYKTHGY